MSNRLRAEILEEEQEIELIVEEKPPVGKIPDNFFTLLLQKGVVSTEAATRMLPFLFFVAFLGMVYIANRHMAENNIRDIDKLSYDLQADPESKSNDVLSMMKKIPYLTV
ncbi:MAG: hypothetical protein EOP43_04005, partial [Sphingobacteriaceae bacterium]